MTRTQKSLKNLITAFTGQFFDIIISIVSRIVFVRCLGAEYLGLNGLFTNILTIFSLAELGVGQAINVALYKPLVEKNIEKVKSLMALYRKAYVTIGCAVAGLGFSFTPFYKVFMSEVPAVPKLTVIYWLFTINTSISYFFSYKRALIICDEKRYISSIYHYGAIFLLNVTQIFILLFTRNYILYLILQVLFTLGENMALSRVANHMYPYLLDQKVSPLTRQERRGIWKYVSAMVVHKAGAMVVISSDNLMLSRLVGLTAVGVYSNYCMITDALHKVIRQIFESVLASVGNLNVSHSKEDRRELESVFNHMFFLNFYTYGFCACCLWGLFNPFIRLWLGEAMLFDQLTVLAIVVNFYLYGMRQTTLTFYAASGLYYYDRYKPPVEIVINITASVLLANKLGAAGVIWGTVVSTMATCIWIEPHVVYKYVFHKTAKTYAVTFIKYTLVVGISCALMSFFSDRILFRNEYINFGYQMGLSLLIPNCVFSLVFCKSESFRYYLDFIKSVIRRKIHSKGRKV